MKRATGVALACCLFYFCIGSLWISKPGLQADEALFAQPLFDPLAVAESMSVFHHSVPLMIMSYLGCLKTLLYAPLLWTFAGSPPETMAAVVRLPMVALGAFSIWLVYCILRRLHSERAGAIAAILLATDTLYLWLSRCDWGPVTLQHVLALLGSWMLLRFHAYPKRAAWLGGAGFLFGLALWDKTVFLWPAAALITGAVLLWRQVRPLITPARVALLIVCFSAGAYPWIRHNVRSGGATFEETGHFSTEGVGLKLHNFFEDLNGNSLLGYMIRDRTPKPAQPDSGASRAVISLARELHFPRRSIVGSVFVFCFLAALYVGGPGRVAALMFSAGLALMVFTKGGGAWSYHALILWPLPQVVMALMLAQWRNRIRANVITGVCAVTALMVTTTHFAQLHLYGGAPIWSDAVYRLPAAVKRHTKTTPVGIIDWGLLEQLQLLGNGKLRLDQSIDRPNGLKRGKIYAGHVAGSESIPGVNTRLIADARKAGCRLRVVETIPDSLGVPIFQLTICE